MVKNLPSLLIHVLHNKLSLCLGGDKILLSEKCENKKLKKCYKKSWFLTNHKKWPHGTEMTNWMGNKGGGGAVGWETNILSFQDPVQFSFSLVLFTLVYDIYTV